MHPSRGAFRSLKDKGVALAIVRIDFRALPCGPRILTVCLRRVAPGMLNDWLPGYQLLIKSVKISLGLISLRERVNVRTTEICRRHSTGFPADVFQGEFGIIMLGIEPCSCTIFSVRGSK